MATKVSASGFHDWTPDRLPDLSGKIYVITGGNAGIGFEAARMLGQAGANLVLACRSIDKAERARDALKSEVKGTIDVVQLDLSDLASVRAAAAEIRRHHARIDGLINNAGIMQTPHRKTKDGFELQFGTNHLGHFLWTSLLIDLVEAAEGRVVTVSSIAHKFATVDLDDLMSEKRYSRHKAYALSKVANLMFALELDRRLQAHGYKAISIACHPGYANTLLQSTGPTGFVKLVYKLSNPLLAQRAEAGAIPTVLAAAGKEARRGAYYGPQHLGESRGPVSDANVSDIAADQQLCAGLWQASEDLIAERFNFSSR